MTTECECAASFEAQASLVTEMFATACASVPAVEYGAIQPEARRVGLGALYDVDTTCCQFKKSTEQVVEGLMEGIKHELVNAEKVFVSPVVVEQKADESSWCYYHYIRVV